MTLYQVLHELQILLAVILGTCPLCCQPVTLDRLAAPLPQPNKVILVLCSSLNSYLGCGSIG
jgi:hypothetical protein